MFLFLFLKRIQINFYKVYQIFNAKQIQRDIFISNLKILNNQVK